MVADIARVLAPAMVGFVAGAVAATWVWIWWSR